MLKIKMLKIFQSDKFYLIFMSLRFIISVLLMMPYIKNIISNTHIIKIFKTTIYDYFIMTLLVTLGSISMGNKFSIFGYIFGLLFLSIIIISSICLSFVCANEISQLKINKINEYKNKIKNTILESTSVLSILTILLTSIIINNIISLKDNRIFITMIFVFLSTKILGHYYTKMGDIISDFKNKILSHNKEDNSLDDYSKIDNIGDIFGDCYGEIISFIILACFIFKFTFMGSNMTDTYGSYLDKSYIITIIMYILYHINDKIKNLGLIFLLINIIFNIIEPFIKYFAYYGYNITDVLRYSIVNFGSQLFILLPVLLILFLFNNIIIYITNYLYKRCVQIPICGIIENISISTLLAFIIPTISIVSVRIANQYLSISYYSLFELFTICGSICLYNTIFSVFADSINGIIKKKNLITNNQQEENKIIDEYLEELDNNGNILKLEAKILMNIFAQILILLKSGIINFYIKINDLYIFLIFFVVFTTFSTLIYKSFIDINNIKRYMYELPFYTFLVLITGNIGIGVIFNFNKTYGISVLMFLLSISNFSNIAGSIFDCIKKKAEINNYKDIDLENYKIIVQNDIIGDFLKDVLGPILFGISISCFIYL
ncbi:inorganic H+ pyrophosphatase [uncultured bacterium]|nr:inorganic H+ pyrophosphatase [uncultured bacterium]